MLLEYCPVPVPSEVFESAVVGLAEILQHTPLAVMAELPSELTSPPLVALVRVILVTAAVDNVGWVTVSFFLHPPIKESVDIKITGIIILFITLCFKWLSRIKTEF